MILDYGVQMQDSTAIDEIVLIPCPTSQPLPLGSSGLDVGTVELWIPPEL